MDCTLMDYFARQEEVEAHQLPDGSLLLFAQSGGTAVSINECGARLWSLCDGTRTVDQFVDELTLWYDAPRGEVDQDARGFLETLLQHGLLYRRTPNE